jgi:hypothetical protein
MAASEDADDVPSPEVFLRRRPNGYSDVRDGKLS